MQKGRELLSDNLFGNLLGSSGEGVDGSLGGIGDLFDGLFNRSFSLLALVTASRDREHHRDDCDRKNYFFHGLSTFTN